MIDWQWIIVVVLSIIVGPIIASEYAGWRLSKRIRKEIQKLAENGNPKVRDSIVNWGAEIFKGILQSKRVQEVLKEQTDKFVERFTVAIKKELREIGEELAAQE